jgi:hypothetical protein
MAVVVTRLWAEWFWVQFLMVQEIFIFKMCGLPVVPTQPPVQCVLALLSWGGIVAGVWIKPLTSIHCQA